MMLKRPKARSLVVAFSLLSVLILILSACGPSGTPSTGGTTSGKPVHGGTWVDDLFEEPTSLIPLGSAETFADIVDQTIWTALFVGDSQGQLHPGLASEIPTLANGDISADLKTWTFKLKPNLKWSDGQPITADDVDFSWRLWTNPKFGAASTLGYNLITSADVSADKLSITFHLKQAFEPFMTVWADGLQAPLPKHVFASMAPDQVLKSSENLKPSVASGPFMISESQLHDHYTVVKNPNYYRASEGLPYLDKIVFRIVANDATILKDFQSGAIDSAYFLDVSKTDTYKAISGYHAVINPISVNFEVSIFNFQNPILGKDLAVRKAIAMAIDHNTLIKTARKGTATPQCTDHSKAFVPGYQADAACPKFDPAGANALLDQDGWVKGSDGYRSKGGQKLEFKYSTTANKPWRDADELIIQSNLKDIGIKINIQNYPASTYFGPFLNGGKHDIAEYENSWTYDADNASGWACNQIPPNGSNWTWYCNPNLDKLFQQEEGSADPAVRQDAFNKIHEIELTDFPFVVLYSPTDLSVAKNVVHNYLPSSEGAAETINNWEWWCDGGKC